ncbi:MAG TPA: HAD domain-containing protein [Candidatus Acidoferrum sp.]|nr:HAD domain-containing protein [Candidatus Acidoferrum sp.]
MSKPILCLDFDGVLHSYTSGWKGAAVVPDLPVVGAIKFLDKAIDHFDVQVFSSRSHQEGGTEAMRSWLRTHVTRHFDCEFHHGSPREFDRAMAIMDAVKFATEKPPALVTIDDRALTFTGKWPNISDLLAFKPWNKRPMGATGQYPQGVLNDDDEGELRLGVTKDPITGLVHINFGKPVAWFALSPPEAIELAKVILKHAGERAG